MNATSGSYLACCFPPNPPPGSGAMIRTFDSGRRTRSAMTRWSQFGCWIALQTTIPSLLGAAMNACGSMANWVTIGKVCALDHDVRFAFGRLEVAPRIAVLAEDVRARVRVIRPERRILDERRIRCPGRRHGVDRRSSSTSTCTRRAALGRVERLGGDRGNGSPWNFVSPIAGGRSAAAGSAASGPGGPRRS